MTTSLKIDFYDSFRCIAEQCSFSCCKGWDISVDSDTLNRWEKDDEQKEYLYHNLTIRKYRRKSLASIRMGTDKCCPFLNNTGLCRLVIDQGEEYLPKTCRTFPRINSSQEDLDEFSLSCACPEVVDMINSTKGKLKFLQNGDVSTLKRESKEFMVRKSMISIFQSSNTGLKDKILLTFYMLLDIRIEPKETAKIMDEFQNENDRKRLTERWGAVEIASEDTLRETNELFLDIAMNYRKEKQFKYFLQDIYEEAEQLETENSLINKQWNEFCKEFEVYENLLENCMVTKIFTNCFRENMDELILEFQLIVTQYLMIRHSAFLKSIIGITGDKSKEVMKYKDNPQLSGEFSKMNAEANSYAMNKGKINYEDIRYYIVIYSRIIEYNKEGIREFWKENFDEAVWEFGYMLLLN